METLTGDGPRTPIRRLLAGREGYPPGLLALHRPPEALWVRGPGDLLSDRMIAIAGTRRATAYGRRMAHRLAWDLAARGWTIVSGLAAGIDAAAHRGALEAEGSTVAVLGCGLRHVYPAAHEPLQEAIARTGLLVSELPPDHPPRTWTFPSRNRIIAALARAVVVVQAGARSGALITANEAVDLSREVLAVPGPADHEASRGVHALLREGAGLVETADDVLEAVGWGASLPPAAPRASVTATATGSGDARARLAAALERGPAGLDGLAITCGLPVPRLLAALADLELAGAVSAGPDGRYELAHPGPRRGRTARRP